jgi:anti-sigma B factor antagonist
MHEVHIERHGATVVARLTGEVDSSNASAAERALRGDTAGDVLVLDLRDVEYLDSAGIAMLDALRRATRLCLVLTDQSITARALAIAGFDQLVPVFPSVDEALTAAS